MSESRGSSGTVTRLLLELSSGRRDAFEELVPLLYDELRRLARHHLRRERAGHTLDSVALVGEAWLRLAQQRSLSAVNRAHFFATASGVMRRILVDHARARGAGKRGGGRVLLDLDHLTAVLPDEGAPELLELDDALGRLEAVDQEAARLVVMTFFGGLTHQEIAELRGVSLSTVRRRWRYARAWLAQALGGGAPGAPHRR